MSPKDKKFRAALKELIDKANDAKAVNSNQVVTRSSDGFEMIGPGPGPRRFKKVEAIDVPGDPWADELVANRR